MATKAHKRQAKDLIEALESRVHAGPPIHAGEINSARDFLVRSEFSRSSDYYNRLSQIQGRVESRASEPSTRPAKRNYGGEAGGRWLQIQSAYDHVIISTCYEGELNWKSGKIKLSHRFNAAGRIDFVELKFLRSMEPVLDGTLRKLVLIKNFQEIRKDWRTAEAFVLQVLPRELVFLFSDIFRCERNELMAWLINIGHRLVGDVLHDLRDVADRRWEPAQVNPNQSDISGIRTDEVALPIMEQAARLEATTDLLDPKNALVRYPESI